MYSVSLRVVDESLSYFNCEKVEFKSGALLLYNCYESHRPQDVRFIKGFSINNLVTFEVEKVNESKT